MKTVKVTSIETTFGKNHPKAGSPLLDKNGVAYKLITVSNSSTFKIVDEDTGELIVALDPNPLTNRFKAYEKSYLNEQPEFGWNVEVGNKVLGTIVQLEVEPYELSITTGKDAGKTRKVNQYKTFVGGNTDHPEFEREIIKAFNSKGHYITTSGTVINEVLEKSPELDAQLTGGKDKVVVNSTIKEAVAA